VFARASCVRVRAREHAPERAGGIGGVAAAFYDVLETALLLPVALSIDERGVALFTAGDEYRYPVSLMSPSARQLVAYAAQRHELFFKRARVASESLTDDTAAVASFVHDARFDDETLRPVRRGAVALSIGVGILRSSIEGTYTSPPAPMHRDEAAVFCAGMLVACERMLTRIDALHRRVPGAYAPGERRVPSYALDEAATTVLRLREGILVYRASVAAGDFRMA